MAGGEDGGAPPQEEPESGDEWYWEYEEEPVSGDGKDEDGVQKTKTVRRKSIFPKKKEEGGGNEGNVKHLQGYLGGKYTGDAGNDE